MTQENNNGVTQVEAEPKDTEFRVTEGIQGRIHHELYVVCFFHLKVFRLTDGGDVEALLDHLIIKEALTDDSESPAQHNKWIRVIPFEDVVVTERENISVGANRLGVDINSEDWIERSNRRRGILHSR